MCVNFAPPTRSQLTGHFHVDPPQGEWPADVWPDQPAPVLIDTGEGPYAFLASFGFVPKQRQRGGRQLSTQNARSETVGRLPTYRQAWAQSQLCLVPMQAFVEPCYETGRNVWTRIGLQKGEPFAVAALWRGWRGENGDVSHSFTLLTINADDHPLMRRMHKPGDEKRSLVVLPPAHYGDWLRCRDPATARGFLRHDLAVQLAILPS